MIDNADNGRIDWSLDVADRSHRRKTFLYGQDAIADSGIDGIQRHDHIAHGLAVEIERLNQQDLLSLMGLLLPCRNDMTDDPGNDHDGLSTASTMAMMAASVGTSFGLKAKAASRPRQT